MFQPALSLAVTKPSGLPSTFCEMAAAAAPASSSSSDGLRSALLSLDKATFYARFAALRVRPVGLLAARGTGGDRT